jgi:hypothetical protein
MERKDSILSQYEFVRVVKKQKLFGKRMGTTAVATSSIL